MYFKSFRGGYSGGDQVASGSFLVVVQHPSGNSRELRAFARHVKMRQLGHWMMGSIKIGNYSLSVSGGFGSDGLPFSLGKHYKKDGEGIEFTPQQKMAIWDQLVPVPQELAERYWKADDGWNSVPGSVAPDFRKWANENVKALRKPLKIPADEVSV